MVQTGIKLNTDPEIIEALRSGTGKLWSAVHDDGSDNRIDADEIMKANDVCAEIGLIDIGAQLVRKLVRNLGKTDEDFSEEKEAARVNRTAGALEEMLLEYLQSAQEGRVDPESLDELIDTLTEIEAYCRAGELKVSGEKELAEIYRSIAGFTTAIAEGKQARPAREAETTGAGEFARIREQLIRQRELIARMTDRQ